MVSPPIECRRMHFCKAYPSCTGVAVVFWYPVSRTTAEERPTAKDDKTASLHKKREGTLYFSNKNSVSLSLKSLLWIEFSVKINGVSFTLSIRLLISDVFKISSRMSKSTKPSYNNDNYLLMPSSWYKGLMDIWSRLKFSAAEPVNRWSLSWPFISESSFFDSSQYSGASTPATEGITLRGQSSPL